MAEKFERSARSFGSSAAELLVSIQDRRSMEESQAIGAGLSAMMDGFRENGGFGAIAKWSGKKWGKVLKALGAVIVAVGELIAAIAEDD